MRPIEMILGPTGAQRVEKIDGEYHVVCRNSLSNYEVSFGVDENMALEIQAWIDGGKSGMVQDVFPELTVEQREMMISGMNNEAFDKACG